MHVFCPLYRYSVKSATDLPAVVCFVHTVYIAYLVPCFRVKIGIDRYKNGMHENYLKQTVDAEGFVLLDSVYAALGRKCQFLKHKDVFKVRHGFHENRMR